MKKCIYLIGHINPSVPETYTWRDEVQEAFKDTEFDIINPCDSGFDTKLMWEGETDEHRIAAYRKKGTRLLVPKSLDSVRQSTIAIANLNMYGSPAPSLGTYFELAWYYTHPDKSVIGLYNESAVTKSPFAGHPFVLETIDVWTVSVKEACNMVNMFFE
jgi:hypothetical protein